MARRPTRHSGLLVAGLLAALAEPASPRPDEEDPSAARLVRRELVVLDASGAPCEGVWVAPYLVGYDKREERLARGRFTDREGRVLFFGPPGQGYSVVTGGVAPEEQVDLGDEPVVLRLDGAVPFEVEPFDVRTGAAVVEGVRVSLTDGSSYDPQNWTLRRLGGAAAPLRRGYEGKLQFAVEAPEGLAAWQAPAAEVAGPVSIFAERLRVRLPLFPEARIVLDVRNPRGRPAGRVHVESAWFTISEQVHALGAGLSGPDGRLRVRGVPDLPGESVLLVAGRRGESAATDWVALEGDGREHVVPARLGSAWRGPTSGYGCGFPRPDPEGPTEGASLLRVRVVRRNGADAVGALVRVEGLDESRGSVLWRTEARTDRIGDVEFPSLPAGAVAVEIREPGFVRTRVEAAIEPFSSLPLRIDEPPGRTVRVRVRGSDGSPIAGAAVTLRPDCRVPHAVVSDGVQVLGRYTDAAGECLVPEVPEGGGSAWVEFGSRSEIESFERGADDVEVVLPRRE